MSTRIEDVTTANPSHQMQPGKQLTLERDKKGGLLLKEGIANLGKTIPKGGSMAFDGVPAFDSKLTIEDAGFLPHIITRTTMPLKVDGSFVAAQGSTQVALVDITPVALTGMKGVDRTASKYTISTSDKHLGQPRKEQKFPEGTKTFTYKTTNGEERTIIVEPGARVDFVNGLDGNKPLFTLDGSEPMEITRDRLEHARNNAMTQVIEVLDGKLFGDAFEQAKIRAGLPAVLEKGPVTYKALDAVNSEVAAVSDHYIGVPINRESGTATADDKRLRNDIVTRVNDYFGHTSEMLGGDYPQLGKGENNKGKKLGNAMQQVKDAATQLVNEENDGVRPQMLAKLHAKLDEVELISGELAQEYKEDFVGRRAQAIHDQFGEFHKKLNESEALRDNRQGTSPAEGKKQGTVPASEGKKYADTPQQGLLARLAQLAMSGSGEHSRLDVADVGSHEGDVPSVPMAAGSGNTRAA